MSASLTLYDLSAELDQESNGGAVQGTGGKSARVQPPRKAFEEVTS